MMMMIAATATAAIESSVEMVVVGDKGHLYFVRRYMHADERLSA